MKKIFLIITIILIAVIAALKIVPTDAKSSPAVSDPQNKVGEILAKRIMPATSTPAVSSTTQTKNIATVSTTTIKKATQEIPAKKAVTVKKTTTVKAAATSKSGVKWAASGLKAVGGLSSFDYSTSIRNAYLRKVEAYAKRNNITLITAAVVNSMHQ